MNYAAWTLAAIVALFVILPVVLYTWTYAVSAGWHLAAIHRDKEVLNGVLKELREVARRRKPQEEES